MNAVKGSLRVEALSKRYFGVAAVDDLSYAVPSGSVLGIIGPNGSGKSTSIDCITGFQPADSGRWFLGDIELTGMAAHRIARGGLVRTFQNVQAYDDMTLIENLCVASQEREDIGWLRTLARSAGFRIAAAQALDRAYALLATVGLSELADAPALALSYGQRKLLAIAAAMMARPQVVILDEPVAGVNPTMILHIEEAIRKLNATGTGLIIIEHNVDFVMNLCERIVVLEAGRKIAEGSPQEIRRDERVLAAYLGKRRKQDAEPNRRLIDGAHGHACDG
ncbi:MAG: ABC transporter ATP-binding protein [Lautropia sp.]